jgi:hypothetical protein
MKIINLGRGQGKTTRLLYASEFQNVPILCKDWKAKRDILHRAQELGLNIPEPIAASDLTHETIRSSDLANKNIFVDEVHLVLQRLLNSMGMTGEIKAITLSEKEN